MVNAPPVQGVTARWLGHSTVLLRIDGFTIITDPVLHQKCGIHIGPFTLGLRRIVPPAIPLDKLPHIDLILLSHAHMDHLDTRTLKALESRKTQVITAHRTSDLLRARRYAKVHELRWGESVQAGEARVTGIEVKHWGARYQTDNYRGYNGYTIEVGRHKMLFAGDTADTHAFRKLRSTIKPSLAIFPIGAYNPWIAHHCTPEQAWRMANEAGADVVLPVHHKTFILSREPLHEPIERLMGAAGASSGDRVAWRDVGESYRWN